MGLIPPEMDLSRLTTREFSELATAGAPLVVLLPVGAIEPHGPHLALSTDVVISQAAAAGAVRLLGERGFTARIAPAVPYGVTNCAAGFAGAVSVPADALTAFLAGVVGGWLKAGAGHVCLVNNHLEPAHDAAVRAASDQFAGAEATATSPLAPRWARTLSEEFKSGACHAGCYETSIVLAAAPELVKEEIRKTLPEVAVSLSEKLGTGISDFQEMGLSDAYAGAPADATSGHGAGQIDRLAEMIATEIQEALREDS